MAKEGLTKQEINYLAQSIFDSRHMTNQIRGLCPTLLADHAGRRTLERFRFGTNSFHRKSRRMQYPIRNVGEVNPYSFTLEDEPEMTHRIYLTTLLKTALTDYKPFEWHARMKERKVTRELVSGGLVSPESLAREFRRVLLMPSAEDLEGEAGDILDVTRELIRESHAQGYEFGLLGSYRKTNQHGKVVAQVPLLFLPGVNYLTPCDGVDSPLRVLESLEHFCAKYAFPREKKDPFK